MTYHGLCFHDTSRVDARPGRRKTGGRRFELLLLFSLLFRPLLRLLLFLLLLLLLLLTLLRRNRSLIFKMFSSLPQCLSTRIVFEFFVDCFSLVPVDINGCDGGIVTVAVAAVDCLLSASLLAVSAFSLSSEVEHF